MDETAEEQGFREDTDSLYRMPMAIVPLETVELRRGTLIKNVSLDPAIELFRSAESGSGQLLINDLDNEICHHMFGWPQNEVHPDLDMLRQLGRLTSYDVYSLRIQFREIGIEPSSVDYLKLSEDKKQELRRYMQMFTLPLIDLVYGDGEGFAQRAQNIVDLFRDPNTKLARQNLERLAQSLQVDIEEIPKFLEDFSDIYLSLAYFQEYVDDLTPKLIAMTEDIHDLQDNWEIRQDPRVTNTLAMIETDLNELLTSVTGRFEAFRQQSDRMWEDISAEKFKQVKETVTASQKTVGGVLCGLGIKLNAWNERFPKAGAGSPNARSEMLFSEVLPSLDRLVAMEKLARQNRAAA